MKIPTCTKCQSSDVRSKAFAYYQANNGQWRLDDASLELFEDDDFFCVDCADDCEIRWTDAPDASGKEMNG